MVRGALAALLELEPDLKVVAQAANGREAERLTRELKPDIAVTDIEMPEWTGIGVCRGLEGKRFEGNVIILTTFARPGYSTRSRGRARAAICSRTGPRESSQQRSDGCTPVCGSSIQRSPPKHGARTPIR